MHRYALVHCFEIANASQAYVHIHYRFQKNLPKPNWSTSTC